MDELKRYVDDHRDDFELPTELSAGGFDELWNDIDQGITAQEKQAKRLSLFSSKAWKVAAMLILTIGLAWLAFQWKHTSTMANANPEWMETEQFYTSQINEKMQVLEAKRAELDGTVFDDLNMLDSAFKELKDDLQDNADNEEVIEAMIQNYRIKLQLLEEILREIETDETKETDQIPAA
ncbi:MAG: hypothetical protein ACPGJS_08105 [Flammeovirgaceae bacterium]